MLPSRPADRRWIDRSRFCGDIFFNVLFVCGFVVCEVLLELFGVLVGGADCAASPHWWRRMTISSCKQERGEHSAAAGTSQSSARVAVVYLGRGR